MKEELKLTAEMRKMTGSAAAGRLRRIGMLPAVVYGEGKVARTIQVHEHAMSDILRHHASGNVLLDLDIAGDATHKVLLKDVQHHPVTGRLLHVDFHSISMTEKLRIDVPVELAGEPVGEKEQGGVLEQLIREVEIECLPTDILEQIEVDVSDLRIGDSLTVADIQLDTLRYTILTDPDVAVAAVAAPRIEEEPTAEEEELAAAVAEGEGEPEVIRPKKEEEEGAEPAGESESGRSKRE